jgi:hypothetical protein
LPVSSYQLNLPTANRGIETYRLEVAIFSSAWWEKPIDEVLRTCIERHRSVV